MKKISNSKIISDIFSKDLLKIKLLQFILVPIIISSMVYTYMEVQISDLAMGLNLSIEKRSGEISALKSYILQILIVAFLTELNGYIFTGVVQFIYRNTAKTTFKKFITLTPKQFNKIGSGEIQTIIDRKSKSSSELIEVFVTNLFPIAIKLIFALYAVGRNMGPVAGYIMFLCIFVYGSVTIGIAIWRANIRRELNKSENKSYNKLQDGLINHETIVSYRTADFEVDKFDEYLIINESNSNKLWRALYALNFIQRLIFLTQTFLIIYFGITGYLDNDMSPGQLIYLMSISTTVAMNLSNLGYLYSRYTQAIINARSTYDTILNLEVEADKIEVLEFKDKILFENVSFQYDTRKVFSNLNFEIRKGEKVAIIGKNGAGKSTLMKLFLKFEDFHGDIKIDDTNIINLKDDSYRNLIGYIPQNSFLFNETVNYNIKYGSKNVTDDEIFAICKKFNLFEVFSNLENGFDTNVGERGRLLSGGEKQKILLMRSMLRKKEILVLDEPTAALDKKSESNIVDLIFSDKECTVFMILHNLELLNKFDKILYINEGQIEVVETKHLYTGECSDGCKRFIVSAVSN